MSDAEQAVAIAEGVWLVLRIAAGLFPYFLVFGLLVSGVRRIVASHWR